MGVEVADHATATVVVHQHRQHRAGLAALRAIQAQRDLAVRPGRCEVAHFAHLWRIGLCVGAPVAIEAPRVGRRKQVRGGQAGFFDQVEQRAGVGVQHGEILEG